MTMVRETRHPVPRRFVATLLAAALLVPAACGGGSGASPAGTALGSGRGTQRPAGTAAPTSNTPSRGTSQGDTGVLVRLVNLWVQPTGPGPDVAVVTGRDDPPLLTVRYGEVSDYLAVPLESGTVNNYESLYVFRADDIGNTTGSPLEFFTAGQRVTVIVEGIERGGVSELSTHAFWERGSPDPTFYFFGHGPAWPDTPAGQALVVVFAGALDPLPADLEQWWYTSDGACLADAATGAPPLARTGTDPAFFVLAPGTHQITASKTGCAGPAAFPGATVEVKAGDRIGVFPYGTGAGDLQLLVLDLTGS